MSLWSLFISLAALAVALSMFAAVWRPRDGKKQIADPEGHEGISAGPPVEVLTNLVHRVDALEAEVDDLNRLTTALREENEYLQQRLDAEEGGLRTGGGS